MDGGKRLSKERSPIQPGTGGGVGDKMILHHRSIDDFNSNYEHEYGLGIVVCHDGKIFAYRSYQFVSAKRYELEIADYKKMGYTEYEAQIQTLRKLSKEGMIDFKEV